MANTIFKRVFSETVARIYEYGVKIHAVTRMAESNLCDSFNAFCFLICEHIYVVKHEKELLNIEYFSVMS